MTGILLTILLAVLAFLAIAFAGADEAPPPDNDPAQRTDEGIVSVLMRLALGSYVRLFGRRIAEDDPNTPESIRHGASLTIVETSGTERRTVWTA